MWGDKGEDVEAAKAFLTSQGYVVLKAKSYRQAQERQHIAQVRAEIADEHAESTQRWARDCLTEERRLGERCTYLYGLACTLGATREQLSGGL